jgi:hypothetical protein
MIKTYDEALKTLNDVRKYLAINRADDCVEELDKVARYFINEKHKENPSFSDCIKEWKKRGWEYCYDDYYNWHCFTNKKENDTISIDSKNNEYWTSEMTFIDIELNNLIQKTLKALEELHQ